MWIFMMMLIILNRQNRDASDYQAKEMEVLTQENWLINLQSMISVRKEHSKHIPKPSKNNSPGSMFYFGM
jgi:hypothetical protein